MLLFNWNSHIQNENLMKIRISVIKMAMKFSFWIKIGKLLFCFKTSGLELGRIFCRKSGDDFFSGVEKFFQNDENKLPLGGAVQAWLGVKNWPRDKN